MIGRLLPAIALTLGVAGCANLGTNLGANFGANFGPGAGPSAQARSGPIAFESVEGVPPEVFHSFVRTLNEEAAARQITVVTRGSDASYRIRSYLALDAGRGALDWAWDVYDSGQQRVVRLGGAEPAGGATRRAWSAADDQVLRRVAQAGLQQLAAFLAAGPAAPGPGAPPPERSGPAVALLDDARPEAAGIFRLFDKPQPVPTEAIAELAPDQVPLPRRRPDGAGRNPAAIAYAGER